MIINVSDIGRKSACGNVKHAKAFVLDFAAVCGFPVNIGDIGYYLKIQFTSETTYLQSWKEFKRIVSEIFIVEIQY